MSGYYAEDDRIVFKRPRWWRRVDWWHWILTLLVGGVAGFIVSYVADVREPYIVPMQCSADQVQYWGITNDDKIGPVCQDADDFVEWWEDWN